MTDAPPKLFISYSWTSPDHEKKVLDLAKSLCEDGVDVIMDKWNLKEGNDAFAFMEKMVTDPDIKKVAIICDKVYAEKADKRKGGVGAETQIISSKVYSKAGQSKFVAVIFEKDENGNPYQPSYYEGKIYIDLSTSHEYFTNYEQLLRWIFDKPLHPKPKIGKAPSFLENQSELRLVSSIKTNRVLEAIRSGSNTASGLLFEYFAEFSENFEKFRISDYEGEYDDKLIENIEKFLPIRNEFISLVNTTACYYKSPEIWKHLQNFFDSLIKYLDRPDGGRDYYARMQDNYKFIIQELFLYSTAILLKNSCFEAISILMLPGYYRKSNADYGNNPIVHFNIFQNNNFSLEKRNDRLKLNRNSMVGDLLKERSQYSDFPFIDIMQADFLLYIRGCLDTLKQDNHCYWQPVTSVYFYDHYGPFEVFARAISKNYFEDFKIVLNVDNKDGLLPLFEAFNNESLHIPRWNFRSINPLRLMGFEKLATLP